MALRCDSCMAKVGLSLIELMVLVLLRIAVFFRLPSMPVAHQQMTAQHENDKDDHSEGAADPELRAG
jgi:hypothetical protein